MREQLLQFGIVVAFGAFCFGCGYFIAFIVARKRWRDEMIKRGVVVRDHNGQALAMCISRMSWGGDRRPSCSRATRRVGSRPR